MKIQSGARLFLLSALLLTSGCTTFLPSSRMSTKSSWKTYGEAKAAFDRIAPLSTGAADLTALGFGPYSPNVKVLTYLDVMRRFMPTQAITKDDLEPHVRECIEAKDGCRALELKVDEINSKRTGDLLLDVLGFRRLSHETGWHFEALILLRNDVVVYKLSSGEPVVDHTAKTIHPLGPLQELDGYVARSVPIAH